MSLWQLISDWSSLAQDAKAIIVTDSDRLGLALEIQDEAPNCRVFNIEQDSGYLAEMCRLSPSDLVIVLFSLNIFVSKSANRIFSPFRKPEGVKAKYAFIRLGISRDSLMEGLSTPKNIVEDTVNEFFGYEDEGTVRVTNAAGTDITLDAHRFTTCNHEITKDGGMAFLPPSEISAEVIPNTANGRIVIDVTVGQLYHYGRLLGEFGLVDSPLVMTVENGVVVDIECSEVGHKMIAVDSGSSETNSRAATAADDTENAENILGSETMTTDNTNNDMISRSAAMATELKTKLFALDPACRIVVELGHGLSKMTPTGLIGVDESIVDTCHFGIGNASNCGVHLDVVISKPTIQSVK